MTTQALEALRGRVRGPVITAADSGYDEARRVYNAMIEARPQAVVRCTTAQDVAAVVRYAGETGTELAVLAYFREVIADAPREYGGFPAFQIAPPLPFVPPDRIGDTFLAVVSCWTGSVAEGERMVQGFRDVATTVAEHVGVMPYAALNSAFDGLRAPSLQHYWKACFVTELTDAAITAHIEHGARVPVVNSTAHIYPINGACHDVAPEATAFGHRNAAFATVIAGMWPDPADNRANTAWVK